MSAPTRLLSWLDDRTGYRALLNEALYENVPGGSRWRYVWGSTLVFAFMTQVITGLFLWMFYSPSTVTAWESVHYIQNEMQGGWLLRGIHHFMAQAMVVLLALHLLQVVIDGAYKAPREVNFWVGLILMQIVLGLSLTGYLLPWDQKGYWATRVATNLMGIVPVVGSSLQTLAVGGSDYNHHTVTRFFALHAGVLPILLVGFLVVHVAAFRRHGICAPLVKVKKKDQSFWPDQVLKDAVACLAVMAVVLLLTIYLGAELTAPADGAREYSAARPEWYFLFLFQFLKLFEGYGEIGELVGAIVIPGLVMGVLALMPITGRWKNGHRFNVAFLILVMIGAGVLTGAALQEDSHNQGFANAKWQAHQDGQIAQYLASHPGIPPDGARRMMRSDPRAVAFRVVCDQCLKCHTYVDSKNHGVIPSGVAAPNLYQFGQQAWIEGLLNPEKIKSDDYFGKTDLVNESYDYGMVNYVCVEMPEAEEDGKKVFTPEAIRSISAALAAGAGFEADQKLVPAGKELLANQCANCHNIDEPENSYSAPSLYQYATREWLIGMIKDPYHANYYGYLADVDDVEQKMPAFEMNDEGEGYSDEVIGYIADWVRDPENWYKRDPQPVATPAEADAAADADAGEQEAEEPSE